MAGLVLLAYLGFLTFVLGQSDASLASSVVVRCAEVLHRLGAPAEVTAGARIEFALNAAMFAPVALLAALTVPGHHWANWVVYGFVASGSVEVVQAIFLPLRSAQYVDVVANTAGMLAGALISVPLIRDLKSVRLVDRDRR